MPDIPSLPQQTQTKDYPYFRRVWNTVVMALLASAFIPLLVIGGVIYAYTASALKEKTIDILRAEVIQQKMVIDGFLYDRTRELQLIANNFGFSRLSQPGTLEQVFKLLSRESPAFIDLGVIDDVGRHVTYVGPYDLLTKTYLATDWFVEASTHDVYVSDLFLGFRNIPHAVIAVKSSAEGGQWFLRATIDGNILDSIVKEISYQKNEDAYLVNQDGVYQTTPRKFGKAMAQSDIPASKPHAGVTVEEINDRLRLSAWLEKVPWVSVVEIDKKDAFATLKRIRYLVIYILVLSSIIIVLTVILTTNYLITRLESKRKSIQHLDQQLRRTSRIAASAALSNGVFHRVKDALVNIDVAAQWIAEPRAKAAPDRNPAEDLRNNLQQIHDQVQSARKAIDTYLKIGDYSGPIIKEIDVNPLLDDLIALFDWELQNKHVAIVKDFTSAPVVVRSDPASVRHIIQSVIHNAIEAISKNGLITVQTRAENDWVRIKVSDNGPGIPEEIRQRIFEPLFSTKTSNLGLGLSVSRAAVEKLGGCISVESLPGKGAAFTISFPHRISHDQT